MKRLKIFGLLAALVLLAFGLALSCDSSTPAPDDGSPAEPVAWIVSDDGQIEFFFSKEAGRLPRATSTNRPEDGDHYLIRWAGNQQVISEGTVVVGNNGITFNPTTEGQTPFTGQLAADGGLTVLEMPNGSGGTIPGQVSGGPGGGNYQGGGNQGGQGGQGGGGNIGGGGGNQNNIAGVDAAVAQSRLDGGNTAASEDKKTLTLAGGIVTVKSNFALNSEVDTKITDDTILNIPAGMIVKLNKLSFTPGASLVTYGAGKLELTGASSTGSNGTLVIDTPVTISGLLTVPGGGVEVTSNGKLIIDSSLARAVARSVSVDAGVRVRSGGTLTVDGDVDVINGKLGIENGGTLDGAEDITVGAGGTVEFEDDLTTASSFTGEIEFAKGAKLIVDDVTVVGTDLVITNAGGTILLTDLDSSPALTITDGTQAQFVGEDGEVEVTLPITVDEGAKLSIASGTTVVLDETLTNDGELDLSQGILTNGSGSVVNNGETTGATTNLVKLGKKPANAVAGNGVITGLTAGKYYKLVAGGIAYYVMANGTISSEWAIEDAGALTGTTIYGLKNYNVNDEAVVYDLYEAVPLTGTGLRYFDHVGYNRKDDVFGVPYFGDASEGGLVDPPTVSITNGTVTLGTLPLVQYGLELPAASFAFGAPVEVMRTGWAEANAMGQEGPQGAYKVNDGFDNRYGDPVAWDDSRVRILQIPASMPGGWAPVPNGLRGMTLFYLPTTQGSYTYLYNNRANEAFNYLTVTVGTTKPAKAAKPFIVDADIEDDGDSTKVAASEKYATAPLGVTGTWDGTDGTSGGDITLTLNVGQTDGQGNFVAKWYVGAGTTALDSETGVTVSPGSGTDLDKFVLELEAANWLVEGTAASNTGGALLTSGDSVTIRCVVTNEKATTGALADSDPVTFTFTIVRVN